MRNIPLKTGSTLILICLFAISPVFAQSSSKSITVTTYYPSPSGAFAVLEAKNKTAVGNITLSGNPQLDSMDELGNGDLYVADSIILGNLNAEPDPAASKEGQVIFNNSTKKLQFYNGTWISAGG